MRRPVRPLLAAMLLVAGSGLTACGDDPADLDVVAGHYDAAADGGPAGEALGHGEALDEPGAHGDGVGGR